MSKSICSTGIRWLWLAVVVLVVDLLTKFWVINNFRLGESIDLLPFFNFYYARNYGAAFSSFMGQRWALAAVAITISIILMVMMYRTAAKVRWSNIAFALIIGGALGNLFDRLYHGFVVDFFDFFIGDWHYPTFNVADCAICIGAVMVVLEGFIFSRNEKKSDQKTAD